MKFILSLFVFNLSGCSGVQLKESQKLEIKDTDFYVSYNEYLPPKGTPVVRNIIIMPPTGGENYLDRSYAKQFAKAGGHVKILTEWANSSENKYDLALHQRLHARAVKAIEIVLKSFPEGEPVSLLGTSLGGLFSSIAASKFSNIDRIIVIGAGVPIPELIVDSDQEAMVYLKDIRKNKLNLKNRNEYVSALKREFFLDPTDLEPGYKNKKLGQFLITKDKTVPTANQEKLKQLWQPQLLVEMHWSHFWGIIFTWFNHSQKITDFLIKG